MDFLRNLLRDCVASEWNPWDVPVPGSTSSPVSDLRAGGDRHVYGNLLYVRSGDAKKQFFWEKGGAVLSVVRPVPDGILWGILLEAYVNPPFLRWILKS